MLHFALHTSFILRSDKQGSIKYHFLSLVWLNLGLNPRLLAKTLPTSPMDRFLMPPSSSSSSSCRTANTDIPDPLSPLLPIIHRFRQVFRATSVSLNSCCMYVRAGRPAFAWLYTRFHGSTSLMSSSLLLQQCPACLVRLTWIVFVMGGRWSYIWRLVGCCRQDLFNIACNILL